jgi:parallel beta-helix repeat protein
MQWHISRAGRYPAPAGKVSDMGIGSSALRVAAWCLFFTAVLVLVILASGKARATNDPPLGGGPWNLEWTVNDTRSYAGCTITLGGNLTIVGTGRLDLAGVALVMNCSADGRYGIDVQSGGELIVRMGSNITASSPDYEYKFVVRAGGKLTVADSEIRECGYAWGTDGETAGPYLLSGSCNFTRSLVKSGYYGVVVRGASPSFTDCRFTCDTYGAGLINSSSNFTNCIFDYNNNGANLEGCGARFSNCTFALNSQFGLLAYTSPFMVSDCDLAYNTAGNCVLLSSDARIWNSTIRGSKYGIYASQGSPVVLNCTLFDNYYGVYLYRSSAVIDGCRIDHSGTQGIAAFYGAPSVRRCNITWTGYSPVDGKAYGNGIVAFSSAISLTGGVVENNSIGLESRYSSPSFTGVAFRNNWQGVFGSQSNFNFTNCSFSGHYQEAAYLTFLCTGRFENCSFLCETIGLSLYYQVSMEVRNCTFVGCKQGLRIEECGEGAAAQGCLFDRNAAGATVIASSCRILGCRFSGNQNSSLLCDASNPDVEGNIFICNTADALTLVDSGGKVSNNTFDSNIANGINLRGSGTDISNNTFLSNGGSGIYCFLNKSVPQVHNNTFRGNALGISLVSGALGRYWGNNITANQLAGIYLLDSDGEIFCNTISGQTHGISCNYGSCPDIHGNNISGNLEGGVLCHVNSNATIRRNTIDNNTKFGISVLGSWPKIADNSVSGSLDGITIDSSAGNRRVILSGDRVQGNGWGVRATESVVDIDGCNFTGNWHTGAWMYNCSSRLTRSSFYLNSDGAYIGGGDADAEGCDFTLNNNSGITTESAQAVIDSCFFSLNTDGVMDIGNSTIDVYDGTYMENLVYALFSGPMSVMEWRIEKSTLAQNSWIWLAGNLTVYPGATLKLINITLFMALDAPAQRAIEVQNGGRLEISQNSSVGAGEPSNKFAFRVMAGGNLTFTDGRLQDCGDRWGNAGEQAGLLLLSSSVKLRNVHFHNCTYGLVANGITSSFSYLTFTSCIRAVACLASELELENSSIYYSGINDLELSQGSHVVLLNTTFARGQTSLAGPGNLLEVYWFLNINVAWQNKVLVQHASVTLTGNDGAASLAGYTDDKGWLMWAKVLESRNNGSAAEVKNPYSILVRLSNVTTDVDMTFEKSWTLYVTLKDMIPPYIEVLSPQAGDFLNFTPVVVSGRVHDFETGLEKVEVSADGRLWQPAAVSEDAWSFLAQLPDGSYTLQARASDAVGNRATASVNFTVKTRISVLVVESPVEGLLTRNPSIMVSGMTESGAKIQINGRSADVVNGRFVASVFLSEGNNTVLVTATDAAGNIATIVRSVVLDTAAPFVELLSPANDSYIGADDVLVSGRTEPGARVLVDGLEIVNSDGRFGQSVPLPQELNILNVTVLDAAGNANSTFLTVHVDTEPPGLEIIFPRMGQHTEKVNITVNGTTEHFSTVTAGEFTAVAGEDGRFSMNVTLLYGNNTLLIKSTDRAGNTNSAVWYVVRTRPANAVSSPWLEASILVAAVLAAENIYLFYRYRRKGPAPVTPQAAPTGPAQAPGVPPKQQAGEPPSAMPAGEPAPGSIPPEALPAAAPAVGSVPPEALPVAEILSAPVEARKTDETETVEMK